MSLFLHALISQLSQLLVGLEGGFSIPYAMKYANNR